MSCPRTVENLTMLSMRGMAGHWQSIGNAVTGQRQGNDRAHAMAGAWAMGGGSAMCPLGESFALCGQGSAECQIHNPRPDTVPGRSRCLP